MCNVLIYRSSGLFYFICTAPVHSSYFEGNGGHYIISSVNVSICISLKEKNFSFWQYCYTFKNTVKTVKILLQYCYHTLKNEDLLMSSDKSKYVFPQDSCSFSHLPPPRMGNSCIARRIIDKLEVVKYDAPFMRLNCQHTDCQCCFFFSFLCFFLSDCQYF